MDWIDKVIGIVSPKAAFNRARYRAAANFLEDMKPRRYEAAGAGRRTSGWTRHNTSSTQELQTTLHTIRARSRDLVRNNPYAFRAIQGIGNNVVGRGIRPSIKFTSTSESKQISFKKEWDKWAGKTQCDFDDNLTFYGIQKLVMRTIAEAGEALIIKRRTKTNSALFELQVLEPEFIDTSKNTYYKKGVSSYVMMGVEFDKNGKKTGYHIYDSNPNDSFTAKSSFIPASDVIHVFEVLRPGQVRGVPFGVSSFLRLRDFDEYEDAQLVRQKIAACFAVFVSNSGTGDGLPGQPDDENDEELSERVEPGTITQLQPGDQVSFANPPGAEGYADYSRKILQGGAAGYGVTYELLTGDLSNVNFSSGRMGWIEQHRNITDWQDNMIIPKLCSKVFEWFIDGMLLSGKITDKDSEKIEASWTPPRREMIDPVKETKAIISQVEAGLISYQEAVRQLGYNPDMTLEEVKEFIDKVDKLGLKLSVDYRQKLLGKANTTDSNNSNSNDDEESEEDD